jgi:Caspase domain
MSRSSLSARLRLATTSLALAVAILSAWNAGAVAQDKKLRPPAGEARALVIGIDAYQFEPPLKGAVADARDIESSLRHSGVMDVGSLLDAAADRASVLRSFNDLLSRSQAGDLIILSIAGRGAQEPERFKNSQADAREDVFILAGFDPKTAAGSQQRILGSEFNHLIKQFALKGAQVLFIADAAYSGGLARNVDPRAAAVSYRQAAPYVIAQDALQPISTADDASLGADGLARTTVLAAGERTAAAPEVRIPGEAGFRGALSYAVARALEGAADEDHDGHVTKDELFRYVSQVTYQLSDQRQHVPPQPATPNSGSEVLYGRTRGVVLLDPQPRQETRPPPLAPSTAPAPAPLSPKAAASVPERPVPALDTVRVAVLGNQTELLKAVQPKEANFQPVAVSENPDLVWDPVTLEVVANGDVVARQINRQELPGVIDRIAAINGFKRLAAKAPQTVRVLPADKVYSRDSRIEVQVSGVAQRALLLFNIAGDGTVQALYPIGSDQPILATPDFKFSVVVREPFGADQVVAVTSTQRLSDLEQVLKVWNQQKTPVEVYRLVERYAPPDARIGATSLYTSP